METKFIVTQGDITEFNADAIVNSVNRFLIQGSGICKIIFNKAGKQELEKYLAPFSPISIGESIVSPGFGLKAKYIIHTLTPHYFLNDEEEKELLFSKCYISILNASFYYRFKTLAIPCLGIGHHGWPLKQASEIATKTIQWYLSQHENKNTLETIYFVCYTEEQYKAYCQLIH